MEVAEVSSEEGWRAKASDQEGVGRDIKWRLGGGGMPVVDTLIDEAGNWVLCPV